MENLTVEKNSGLKNGMKIITQEAYGRKQYFPNVHLDHNNEFRIIKRRKLKSKVRSKMIFK